MRLDNALLVVLVGGPEIPKTLSPEKQYALSRQYVLGLTRRLQREIGQKIHVQVISLGARFKAVYTETDFLAFRAFQHTRILVIADTDDCGLIASVLVNDTKKTVAVLEYASLFVAPLGEVDTYAYDFAPIHNALEIFRG